MRTCRGIHATRHGTFLLSTVVKNSRGWKLARSAEWSTQSFIRNFLLLHHRVNLSLSSWWSRTLPQDLPETVIHEVPGSYFTGTGRAELEHYSSLLEPALSGIYPDDMLHVTLVKAFTRDTPDTYCSLFTDHGVIRAGIVIKGALTAVFSGVAIDSPAALEGFLGRIERYWKLTPAKSGTFPQLTMVINALPFPHENQYFVKLDCGTHDPDTLKAAGCALCSAPEHLFSFVPPSPAKKSRYIRSLLLFAALGGVLVAGAAAASLHLYSSLLAKNILSVKNQYHAVLDTNNDIRDMLANGDILARKVLNRRALEADPTTWGTFLQFLGSSRPEGLFFDRLGTDPAGTDASKIRVAITGWSKKEIVVTDFVKTISASPLLQNVSLTTIDRIPKQESLWTFKIVCTLSLTAK